MGKKDKLNSNPRRNKMKSLSRSALLTSQGYQGSPSISFGNNSKKKCTDEGIEQNLVGLEKRSEIIFEILRSSFKIKNPLD